MKASLCPVCNGSGKVFCIGPGTNPTTICHGCAGKGWVEVEESGTNDRGIGEYTWIPQETTDYKGQFN